MSGDLWIRIVLYGLVGGLVGFVARRKKLRPNMSTEINGAVRLPRSTAVVGWILVVVGALVFATAFIVHEEATVALVIGAVFLIGLGILLLVYYKRWYIQVLPEEVVSRKLSGRVVAIRYDSAKWVKLTPNGSAPALRIKGLNGGRIDVNSKIVDAQTSVQKIQYYQQGGQTLQGMAPPQGPPLFPSPQGPPPYGKLPFPTSAPFGNDPHNPNVQDPRL